MNRDAYAHGLASDWKQRSAMSTASKVGGAFEGYRPKEARPITLLGLGFTLIATCLAAFIAAHLGG